MDTKNPAGVQSLTVIEPPLFSIAQGVEVVATLAERLAAVYRAAATISAVEFDRRFDLAFGFDHPPTEFTPEELTMVDAERRELFPGDVMLPLGLVEADYPKRVISGTWSEPFSAVCDRLAEAIGAKRFSLAGGHSAQSVPEFNDLLSAVIQGEDG